MLASSIEALISEGASWFLGISWMRFAYPGYYTGPEVIPAVFGSITAAGASISYAQSSHLPYKDISNEEQTMKIRYKIYPF